MQYNSRTYTLMRQPSPDISIYSGPAHTFSVPDTVQLSRVFPKGPEANAVAKPLAKQVKSVTIGATTRLALITLGGSLPVGIDGADVDAMLADMAAFCASNDAKALFKSLTIGQ